MSDLPQISVITPSFQQGQFLGRTIESIHGQGYSKLEHIVIDGGSTDSSVDVLKRHSDKLSHWVSEKDDGQSHAFNKGLSVATGEIIGWINSDDLYLGNCLHAAAEYFRVHSDIDIVFSDYVFIDQYGRYLKRRKEPAFNYGIYLWTGDCYHANCAGFFRRRVFDQIGGLDEKLQYGMDYELYLRAAKAGLRFGHVRSYWGAYRLHEQSKTVAFSDRQRADVKIILSRYRPGGMSSVRLTLNHYVHATRRLSHKAVMGSYLPPRAGFGELDKFALGQ